MPKKNLTYYVAIRDDVWSIERAEFRAFLGARSRGLTEDEGDLQRMCCCKLRVRRTARTPHQRNGFPRGTDGHLRFDLTYWTPEDYRDCLKAMDDNLLERFCSR